MATRWQQLGAFVGQINQVGDATLDAFAGVGGKWVVPLLSHLGYPDDHDASVVSNMAELEAFKAKCADRGISVGGWFNGWNGGELGTTPDQDADRVAAIVKGHNLGPVVLDLEAAYKNDSHALPALLWTVRQRITTREVGVSTNEPNDSMPYNGYVHHGSYKGSMRRLGIKLLPQWYNAPAYGQGTWMQPDQTMAWVQAHGMEDNWYDPGFVNKRAVPVSFIHGTLEVTGLEGADLGGELEAMKRARQYGYGYGLSLYLLERTPPGDFSLLAGVRGGLYLT